MNANQKDDWYISICTYLKDLTMHAKTKSVKIRGYKVSESLLLKKNQLWVSDNEDLQLEVFKEIHN